MENKIKPHPAYLNNVNQEDKRPKRINIITKPVHPEAFCQKCGHPNPVWYAPNELFNKINGSPVGIMCPVCFQKMADEKGINIIFTVEVLS